MANPIRPVVRLFFPCDALTLDTPDGAAEIRGPLHTIALPPGGVFPFEYDEFFCYAQVTDALGTFRFSVEMLREGYDVVLYRSRPIEVTFPVRGRLVVYELRFVLEDVRFPEPDVYRLRLVCNHAPLGEESPLRFLGGPLG